MKEPYLYISLFDGSLHIGKKLPTESEPRELFDVDVSEVCADGLEVASRKLGSTVLGILKLWHEKSLAGLDGPAVQQDTATSAAAFEAALFLIDRFSAGTSELYLKLVDEILAEAASGDHFASEYLQADWPALRRRLLKQDSAR